MYNFKSAKKRDGENRGAILVLFFMLFLMCSTILASHSYFTTMKSITGTGKIAVLELEFNNEEGEVTDSVYQSTYMADLTPGSTINLTDIKVVSPLWSCYALIRFDVAITKSGEDTPALNYTTVYNLDGEFVNSADATTNTTVATLLEAGVEKNINLSYVLSGDDITNDYMNATVQTTLTAIAIQSSNLKAEVGQEPMFAATTLLNEYEIPYTSKTLTLMVDGVAKSYTLTAGSTMENALKAGGVYNTYNLYNTCGFYTDENLTNRLEGETENFWSDKTLYTKTATLDKLSFYDNAGVSEVYALDKNISGEVVVPAYSPSGNPVEVVRSDEASGAVGFAKCTSMTNIVLPVTLRTIGYKGFNSCTGLTSVYLPDQITTMGEQTFENSGNITSFDLPEELLETPKKFANNCSKLTNIKFSRKMTIIGYMSFAQCSKLTEVEFPSSVKIVNPGAFHLCTALKSAKLNEGLKIIDFQAFDRCYGLLTINFPSTLREIRVAAFQHCSKLEYLNLNEGLEWIADLAFSHCENLQNTTIRLPSTIKQIGKRVYDSNNPATDVVGTHMFYNCGTKNLTSFYIDPNNPYYMVQDGVLYRKNNGVPTVLISYPSAKTQSVYEMPNTVIDAYECSISRAFNLREIVMSDSFVINTRTDIKGVEQYTNEGWANNFSMMVYVYTGVVKYSVRSSNPNYSSDGRSIYSKDGKTLYAAPIYSLMQNDTISFSPNMTTIYYGAIAPIPSVHDQMVTNYNTPVYCYLGINISSSVTSIDPANITCMNEVSEDGMQYTITVDPANTAYKVVNGKIQAK